MAMACYVKTAGHPVALCELPEFAANIEGFRQRSAIRSIGMISGWTNLEMATTDASKALQWADIVIVVTHAGAHGKIARLCAQFITGRKSVLLCPAYVGGGWDMLRLINVSEPGNQIDVLECSVLPFACRRPDRQTVSVHGVKRRFLVSTMGRDDSSDAVRLVKKLFSDVVVSRHEVEAGLHETNFILHPCVALLNMGYVQGSHPWTFYRQGLTERIGALVEAVDAERQLLLRHLGLQPIPLTQWLSDFYGDQGLRGDSIYEMIYTFPPFAQSPGPRSLAHRYFSEDIAYGLVPMSSLARQCGVPVPLTDALIDLGSRLCDADFRKNGRNLSDFGERILETTTPKKRRRK